MFCFVLFCLIRRGQSIDTTSTHPHPHTSTHTSTTHALLGCGVRDDLDADGAARGAHGAIVGQGHARQRLEERGLARPPRADDDNARHLDVEGPDGGEVVDEVRLGLQRGLQ